MHIILLLLAFAIPQQPTPKHQLLRIVQCRRIASEKPHHTTLDCGRLGESPESKVVLTIPESLMRFQGTTFNLYIYNDGEEFPVDRQPKGSQVVVRGKR